MKPKSRLDESAQFFQQDLEHLLDQRQPLYNLANQLPWDELEKDFESYYSDEVRPVLPTRLMADLLLLKQLENLSVVRMLLRPQLKFLYLHDVKLGFFDGNAGSVYCKLEMLYELMISIKRAGFDYKSEGS